MVFARGLHKINKLPLLFFCLMKPQVACKKGIKEKAHEFES